MSKGLPLDFHTSVFCGEARENLGEDCWCYHMTENTGILGVFDGCGGSGAKTHADYQDHSEAFMASRISAGAVYACCQQNFPLKSTAEAFVQDKLKPYLTRMVSYNVPEQTGIKIKGMRTLPSTMAAAIVQAGKGDMLTVSAVWAGDSRVYVLDKNGLSQLTVDDSNQPDPMEGLYDDGTLTNMICADIPFRLNCASYQFKPPFMLLAATDGCFGYVSTPMEFEGMLLHTMLESKNIAQWETNLRQLIASYAGDDHTLCLASFGFGNFRNIQKKFKPRYDYLKAQYLETIWETPWEDRDTRRTLWAGYRGQYMQYIEKENA